MSQGFFAAIQVPTTNIPAVGADELVRNTVAGAFWLAGVVAVIALLVSAFRYITANGDPKKLTVAKNGVLYSVIGIVVVIASFMIVSFVAGIF